MLYWIFATFLAALFPLIIDATSTAAFEPPPHWKMAETATLPPHVKLLIVGEGSYPMPPSMNLGYESFDGSLEDYLAIVKAINKKKGDPWIDLGTIQTQSGPASLSQLTMRTEWGTMRQMHVILVKDHVAYILTASALQQEFSRFYPQFFAALRSLKVQETE